MTDAEMLTRWIEAHSSYEPSTDRRHPLCAPPIVCTDGFSVNVQAGSTHYCQPREAQGPWRQFECGYPSVPVPEWLQWRDGDAPDTDNVFGYVPAEKIMDVIRQHGGCPALTEMEGVA